MKLEQQARDWLVMLKELGINLASAAARQARCPHCGNGIIRFYADTVMGGTRFHSDCCLGSGDLLDLIAKRQNTSRAEALIWLEGRLPEMFLTYVNPSSLATELNARRKKIENLWDVAHPLSKVRNATEVLRICDSRGLPIRQVVNWNEDSLSEQFRVVTAEQVRAVSDESLMQAKRHFVVKQTAKESPAYLVARLFTLPGQVSGMSFFTVGQHNEHIEFHWSVGERSVSDAGYLIHPRQVGGSDPVILMDSPKCALYAIFHAACHSGTPETSIACLIDDTDLCTRSIQPLVGRSITVWCGQLTPRILQFAARLDARVSHLHFAKGKLRIDQTIAMVGIDHRLTERSRSWDDALFDQGDRAKSYGAIYELILAADLDRETVERLANKYAPAHTAMLIERFVRPLSNQFISTSMGAVEQRQHGWVTIRKGKELLIANMCWRVASITYEDRASQVCLEIMDSGAWHQSKVDYQQLVAAPFRVVSEACSRLGLSPFTFDPKWQTRALLIALQFHPEVKVLKHIPLGLVGDRIRTTRTEISVTDGSLQPIAGVSKYTLFPLAGRELPSSKSIVSLCSNAPWVRAVTALVQQLSRHFLGQRELLVVGSGQYARIASQVLHACGFHDATCLPVLRTVDLTHCCDAKRAKRELLGEDALWGNTDHDTAHWLAGMRPTIYLGNKCKPDERFLNDNQIQSIVLHLFARTLAQLHAGVPCSIAANEAWSTLLRECHVEITPPEEIPIVNVAKAVGYWISRGLTSSKLQTTAKKPRSVKKTSVWPDRNPNYFWVHQAAINYMLDSFSLPGWNIAELQTAIEQSGSFLGAERLGRAVAWKFVRSILNNEAQFALRNLGGVEANPPHQSSVLPEPEQFVPVSANQPPAELTTENLFQQKAYTTVATPTSVSGVSELQDILHLPHIGSSITGADLLAAAGCALSKQTFET